MTDGQKGSLEYREDGRMRLIIDRDPDQLKALGLSPRLSHLHYSGRYSIDEAKSIIYHQIEEADQTDRIGKTLVRQFRLKENHLEISGMGIEAMVKLVWKKNPPLNSKGQNER